MKVKIELSPSNTIIAKLLNEKVGIYLAETWAKQFKKYIPADTKMLMNNYVTEPYKVTYNQKYARYQWEGVSSKGRPLNYSKDVNPFAQSHWEQAAFRDKKDEVARSMSEFIKRGGR